MRGVYISNAGMYIIQRQQRWARTINRPVVFPVEAHTQVAGGTMASGKLHFKAALEYNSDTVRRQ